MKIGITGPIASGKSIASALLGRDPDVDVIDADEIGRRLTANPRRAKQIATALGDSSLAAKSGLDRGRTAAIVFSNLRKLAILNRLLHPALVAEIHRALRKSKRKHQIVDAALLFDWPVINKLDGILLVTAGERVRLHRLVLKGMNPRQARNRIRAQGNWRLRRARADWIITNSGTRAELEKKVLKWWKAMKEADSVQERRNDSA